MGLIAKRLQELGIELPPVAAPVANYVPVIVHANLAHVSGQVPRRDGVVLTGQVGRDLTSEQAYDIARLCGISVLAVLAKGLDDDLDRVERCLALTGFVNASPEFGDHPKVINGASDLMGDVFGEAGRHSRAAVGCSSLPMGAAVEVSGVFALRG
jgi:enamine deaminase RidA (YjgF/YER057c/UK114 family)